MQAEIQNSLENPVRNSNAAHYKESRKIAKFAKTQSVKLVDFLHTNKNAQLGTHSKKITGLIGNFSQMADPPPPFWEPLIKKKILFILHFRPLGTFLGFHQKINILPIFLHLLLGKGDPPPLPLPKFPKLPFFSPE